MVDYVSDPIELVRHLNAFAYSEGLDAELANKLQTIPGVAADIITAGAEILYSYRDTLNEQGLRVMAELFAYADAQCWGAFNREGRSKRIVDGAAFELGDRKTKPAGPDPEPDVARRDGLDWRNPEEPRVSSPPIPVAEISPAEPVEG